MIEEHNSTEVHVDALQTSTPLPVSINSNLKIGSSAIKAPIKPSVKLSNAKLSKISSHKVLALGFDCEWRPTTHKGGDHKVAIIQLSTSKSALILQMGTLMNSANRSKGKGGLETLKSILINPKLLKVGVGVLDDLKKLNYDHGT